MKTSTMALAVTMVAADDSALREKAKSAGLLPIPARVPEVAGNLGGQDDFPFGLITKSGADILPPDDKGRFQVTKTASDEYVFRAAPLRNIALTAPSFHSGAVWDLGAAVALMGTAQRGTEISDEEAAQIVAVLHALTGEQPKVEYPILPVETAETPRPDLSALPPVQECGE